MRSPRAPISDPAGDDVEASVRPIVAIPRSGKSGVAIAIGAAVAGLILFSVLDGRRRALSAPAVRAQTADAIGGVTAPPELYIPPIVAADPPVQAFAAPAPQPSAPALPQIQPPVILSQPQTSFVPQAPAPQTEPPPAPARASNSPALVVDSGTVQPSASDAGGAASAGATSSAASGLTTSNPRVRAGAFANRGTTIAQGTLIPAVLETALDSTSPGLARAMVSRDVRGFDGTKVLIPRGSRLIGEYLSNTAQGQKRALVTWVRLIRPDGATIAIGSQAADPLGRGGIRAKVNSHFFERFAGAILQSSLDVGVNLASRAGNGAVVLALPGAVQNSTSGIAQPQQITPTLSVRQGTSISIFVARDLDFTSVETRR